MSIYNRSLDLLSFYDQTGVRLSQAPGSGTAGCMCFSLGKAGGSGGNFCVWISGFAQPEIVYSQPAMGYYVAGSYQPGGKALPQCKDVNIEAISTSVYATANIIRTASSNLPSASSGQ
jgi:hypothetical protein